MGKTAIMGLVLGALGCAILPAVAQEILKHEPAKGSLRPGMAVLVDNGRCPRGQVMEVTAGTTGGRTGRAAPRGRTCVPRP